MLFAMPMKSVAMLQSPGKPRQHWVCGVLSLYLYRCKRCCCLKYFSAASVGPLVLPKIRSCPNNLHCKEHEAVTPARIFNIPPWCGSTLAYPPDTPQHPATRDKKRPGHRTASRPSTTSLTTLALPVLHSQALKYRACLSESAHQAAAR